MKKTQNLNIAIVVIAYNRIDSLKRLIGSLYSADYLGDKVDLIVSIDNSDLNTLVDYAKSLDWPHGEVKIITHEEHLGLKRHVLKCGDLTKSYEYICVLEDDLYVSPSFYAFTKAAAGHFNNFKDIAGISLYSHQWNPYVNRPFNAIEDKFDVFMIQVASSWGQVWNREGWYDFMDWMSDKTDDDLHSILLPSAVSNWSSRSWLKFHNKYLVDKNKYFVYPRISLTTNFSDKGEHASETTTYQIPILFDIKKDYNFPEKIELATIYDAFFENKKLSKNLGLSHEEVDVNLYNSKTISKRFLLTTAALNYRIVRTFGLKLRPIDANILLNIPGQDIYLYDTLTHQTNTISHRNSATKRFLYDIKAEAKKEYLVSAVFLYIRALKRKLGIKL